MGLYGQLDSITINPVAVLANESSAMVGMGLTMEGQEPDPLMKSCMISSSTRLGQRLLSIPRNMSGAG
jgi:alpha-N-acetylglucosaminidase